MPTWEVDSGSHIPIGLRYQSDRLLDGLLGKEAKFLIEIYQKHNGIYFQINKDTIGLIVSPIDKLKPLNKYWRDWFRHVRKSELYEYQRSGVAFGEVHQSGNYFAMYEGKVYYSSHDSADDNAWGYSLEEFFDKALSDPAKFLWDVGCYTRYSDGTTNTQYIPKKFLFDG